MHKPTVSTATAGRRTAARPTTAATSARSPSPARSAAYRARASTDWRAPGLGSMARAQPGVMNLADEYDPMPSSRRPPRQTPTTIGNHHLKPATLMMGYGYDPALSEGSLKPPIFLTSTFVFDKAADGKGFFEGITGKRPGGGTAEGLVYSRFNGPNQEILEDRLQIWEDAEDALTFSSGMTAIAVLLLSHVSPGDVVVHSGPLYAASETIINKILPQFGVHYFDFAASADRAELDEVMARAKAKGRVALIYLESPANPTNVLVDVEAVHASRAAAFGDYEELPPIAIDNTFLGPLWAKPLQQGANLSVYSLTKYAGGHSDLVAGALVGKRSVIDKARMMRNVMGGICDP